MRGTIYFLQEGAAGAIKIGWTSISITKRVAALQVGNSQKLNVLGLIPNQNKCDERLWHDEFNHARKLSEWFFPVDELLSAIKRNSLSADSAKSDVKDRRDNDRIQHILDAFGGATKLAQYLSIPVPTVCAWKGRQSIPQRHWRKILSLAEELSCDVTPECLVNAGVSA